LDYKFIVRQIEIYEIKTEKLENKISTFLCIHDLQLDISYPHPISAFFDSYFINSTLSLNTIKRYAEDLKKFLNFILFKINDEDLLFENLKYDGIKSLSLKHGAAYLNYLYEKVEDKVNKPGYFYDVERILTIFYKWLENNKLINFDDELNKILQFTDRPFKFYELDVKFPRKETELAIKNRVLHDFGKERLDLIIQFIKISEYVAPDITLGIVFQFFGGLRRSEVINLITTSILSNDNGPIMVNIADNWKLIFETKKSHLNEQVKNPRNQSIFKIPLVIEIFKKHKSLNEKIKKNHSKNNKYALFLSMNDGRAISGQMYSYKFNKVKEKFLKQILNENLEDYRYLTSKNWSSHIGRGIYTNLLAFTLGWNESEIAIARGDRSIESSKTYIEEMNIYKKTVECSNILAKEAATYINKYE